MSDSRLTSAVNGISEDDQRITLPICLLSDAPKPFPLILVLESLENNLSALRPRITKRRPFVDKLLNASQFLNTLSEIALARTLLDSGWSISLDERFFGEKDADVVARRDSERNFIDVINLASLPLTEGGVTAHDVIQTTSERSRIVQKVIEKFQQKFEVAIERDWKGRAWVALDFAKNNEENVQAFVQDLFQPSWRSDVTELVRRECSKLTGVILYRYYPTSGPRIEGVSWQTFNVG